MPEWTKGMEGYEEPVTTMEEYEAQKKSFGGFDVGEEEPSAWNAWKMKTPMTQEMGQQILDKLDSLQRRIDFALGDHVLINGRWVRPMPAKPEGEK